jgi:methylglyoxal/glyoxal reductase
MSKIPPTLKLNNGADIPRIGLGVWKIDNTKVIQVVKWALQAGYRHIDTAKVYGNEAGVGQGIRESEIKRSEIFVTTKLSVFDIRRPELAFAESLARLELKYVDLYLIHWPFFGWKNAWKAMETFLQDGKAKAIGVSNFGIKQLEELQKISHVLPAVNQVEISPFLNRGKLVKYCKSRGIAVECYSPLTRGKRIGNLVLQKLAQVYQTSPAQIMIRWGLQHGLVVLPKSQTQTHSVSNLDVFKFHISDSDMQKLDSLNENFSLMPVWSRG